MGKTGEMTDHIIGEIECGERDEVFETLQVIRVREKFSNVALQSDGQSCCCEGTDTSAPLNGPFLTIKMKSDKNKDHIFIITVEQGISGN